MSRDACPNIPTDTSASFAIAPMLAVMVVAGGLRVATLGTREIWLDEASSFYIVSSGEFLHQLTMAHTPPLYYLILWCATQLGGYGEIAMRMSSVLCGMGFVAAAYWAGRQIFDRDRPALLAAAIAAISPIHVYYSQEARAYSLAVLALVVAYGMLFRALRRNDPLGWAGFAIACVLTVYAHYVFVLALVPTVAVLWGRADRDRGGLGGYARGYVRGYVAAAFVAAASIVPWIVWSFWLHQHPVTGTAWIAETFAATPPSLAIAKSFETLAIGSHEGFLPSRLKAFQWAIPDALRALGVGAAVALCAAAVAGAGTRSRLGRQLAILAFAPLVLLWGLSVVRPVYVVGRYDLIAFPGLVLLLGYGLDRLGELGTSARLAAAALGIAYGAALLFQLWMYHVSATGGGNRRLAAHLAAATPSGDVVVFTNLRGLPTIYELGRVGYRWRNGECARGDRVFACVMYPRATERTPASLDPARIDFGPRAVAEQVDDILAARRSRGAKVHVLFGRYASKSGVLAIDRYDELLTTGLEQRGLAAVEVDPERGIMTFATSRPPSRRPPSWQPPSRHPPSRHPPGPRP